MPLLADQRYNELVLSHQDEVPARSGFETRRRYSGRAALVGVLGVALILIGSMLVAMLDAPVVRLRAVIAGFVLIAAGIALLLIAWLGRVIKEPD